MSNTPKRTTIMSSTAPQLTRKTGTAKAREMFGPSYYVQWDGAQWNVRDEARRGVVVGFGRTIEQALDRARWFTKLRREQNEG